MTSAQTDCPVSPSVQLDAPDLPARFKPTSQPSVWGPVPARPSLTALLEKGKCSWNAHGGSRHISIQREFPSITTSLLVENQDSRFSPRKKH